MAAMRKRPTLTEEYTSPETVVLLEHLLDRARKGKLIGVVFAGMERGHRYNVGWAGRADVDPVLAMGLVQRLNKSLMEHAEDLGY